MSFDFFSNFVDLWPVVQKFGTMLFTGFSILTFIGGCGFPNSGGGKTTNKGGGTTFGILKYDPSIRKEGFIKTNAVQSLVDQQINVDGLGLSNIYKIDQINKQMMLILAGGSVYKSIDNGVIWKKLTIYPIKTTADTQLAKEKEIESILVKDNSFEIWDFATVKNNTKIIYLSGKQNGQGKVFRSLDSGETFSQVYVDPSKSSNVEKIALDPANPNLVYAVLGNQKMIKSFDAGNTWKNLKISDGEIMQFGFISEFGNLFYLLIRNKGVQLSDDQGETWQNLKMDKIGADGKVATSFGNSFSSFQKILPVATNLTVDTNTGQVQATVQKAFLLIAEDKLWYSKDITKEGFREIKLPSQSDNNKLGDVAVDPVSGLGKIYLAVENNLMETQNLGESWAVSDKLSLDNGVKVGNIKLIATDKENPEILYLGLNKN